MPSNILLLFLSEVKNNAVSYTNIDGEQTQTTNESAVRYLLKNYSLDKIFIVASEKVRGKMNDTSQTHLEFSIKRFKKFSPDVDCLVVNYNEKGSDDDNLKAIAQIAEQIQDYAKDKNVTLHVDLTGGMRHINMMMLELTRLLEYSGLTVDKILYSNYDRNTNTGTVEELQNVYDLFQLIAGVEEFVNFGSVKALNAYYAGRKISAPLATLLSAMENFAEAIKLCHYGDFRDAIIALHDAVHDFNKHEPADVEDILMARLIGRIHQDYQDLIAIRDKDDLRVIRWCLNNDYLQQALTLYTERIPEYLGKKIIQQTAQEKQKLTERVDKDVMRRNRFYYLLNVYTPYKDHTGKAFKKFCDAVKSEAAGKKNVDVDAWLKTLDERLSAFNCSCADESRLRSQVETFNKIRQEPTILRDLTAPELEWIRAIIEKLSAELTAEENVSRRKKIILNFVNLLQNKDFKNFFPGVVFAKDIRDKYPRAHKVYELLADEIFSVSIPEENFLSIMEKYFKIQDERNHSNHARADFGELKTAQALREFMGRALDEIETNLSV